MSFTLDNIIKSLKINFGVAIFLFGLLDTTISKESLANINCPHG